MTEEQKVSRSLAGIAGIVAIATIISKVVGLLRQVAIGAAFGTGAVADAYSFAYIIPGFLLILLGGINGPFYSAIVSVLAKRKKEEAAPLVETMTTLVGCVLLIVTIFLIIFAGNIIELTTPGLDQRADGQLVKAIATLQLQIMSPIAILAGLIGIGFGTLNVANQYWLPSISPLLSSITVVIAMAFLGLQLGNKIYSPEYLMYGGAVLAIGTLAGALLQWLVQLVAQARIGMGSFHLRFDFNQPGVREVMKIMLPATFSSGMLYINWQINSIFASFIPAAASGLNYANLLVQTPLGVISNVILVPLLPIFSRLTDPNDWPELKLRIRQGLILSAFTMLPLGALMIALSDPIVRVVYERGAFNQAASDMVSSLLVAYGIGMFVYLGRDVLVRVFYALGDGDTPFRISLFNIFVNIFLDWILIKSFGAPGLVLATVGVNLSSTLMLLWLLDRRLKGLPWGEWSVAILGLTGASVVGGFASYGSLVICQRFLGVNGLLIQLLQLAVCGLVGLGVFGAIVAAMKLQEVNLFVFRLRQRFLKR
ncbi:murein biosynthesis integral membrane protein MurJ [Fischerella thermalis CCMEE 5198]|uniref:murein biosynthesis integral membrane protein MurJ n=1 Tax=Fischerella thermalis TaxID=372787 RepID=UPI000C8097E4|nr:murein biosynthesis integral membrane protein MurJ [Fischerella thermalis]PMB00430.1 murein biosynthesis integral membrane protein MurJ [Fischerella thermalis CCMEE 5196]PMB27807.1 murein biosynthesis integral membrane protein MurJ [Fischerella thermalis CCMEE 5198]PMB53073.1 murein biosynthesis integral membrane protein MurJ [Fischerella thermalis CCMEE 5201]